MQSSADRQEGANWAFLPLPCLPTPPSPLLTSTTTTTTIITTMMTRLQPESSHPTLSAWNSWALAKSGYRRRPRFVLPLDRRGNARYSHTAPLPAVRCPPTLSAAYLRCASYSIIAVLIWQFWQPVSCNMPLPKRRRPARPVRPH